MKKIITSFLALISIVLIAWYFIGPRREVVKKDILIVGTNAEYPPFTYVERDTIVGFDIDLINEVARRLGKKMELKDMPFDVLIPEIQRGSIQIIAAGMTPTSERKKELLFSTCYFIGDPIAIIASTDKPFTMIAQLNGQDVVVNEGYTADFYMSEIKGPNLKRLSTPAAAFLALDSGRADAYVAARSTVAPFFKQYGTEKFVVTSIPETEEKYALAISPQNTNLVPKINGILDTMKKDGTIDKLKVRWDLL